MAKAMVLPSFLLALLARLIYLFAPAPLWAHLRLEAWS